MKIVGIVLLVIGLLVGVYAVSMKTTVTDYSDVDGKIEIKGYIYNNGLMNDRIIAVNIAGILCIMGSVFISSPERLRKIEIVYKDNSTGEIVDKEMGMPV